MTWVKFAATILPTLESLELWVGEGADQYVALVTAVHADAPPILQWDRADHRNPVSWYVYVNGSLPAAWGLRSGRYHRVSAVALKPNLWGPKPLLHQGEGVVLLIEGARDSQNASLAIFPETLRSDLHAHQGDCRGVLEGRQTCRRRSSVGERPLAEQRIVVERST